MSDESVEKFSIQTDLRHRASTATLMPDPGLQRQMLVNRQTVLAPRTV